ncbi:MAG: hypothetical protein ACMG6E_07585, partial [Candidatus Roizmanbacteria bacterium]
MSEIRTDKPSQERLITVHRDSIELYRPGQRILFEVSGREGQERKFDRDISVPTIVWVRTLHPNVVGSPPDINPAITIRNESDIAHFHVHGGEDNRYSIFPKPTTEVDFTQSGMIVTTRFEKKIEHGSEKWVAIRTTTAIDQETDYMAVVPRLLTSEHEQLRDEPLASVKLITPDGTITCAQINPYLRTERGIKIDSLEMTTPNGIVRHDNRRLGLENKILIIHASNASEGFVPMVRIRGTKTEGSVRVPLDISIIQIEPSEERIVRATRNELIKPQSRKTAETKAPSSAPEDSPQGEVTELDGEVKNNAEETLVPNSDRQFDAPAPVKIHGAYVPLEAARRTQQAIDQARYSKSFQGRFAKTRASVLSL